MKKTSKILWICAPLYAGGLLYILFLRNIGPTTGLPYWEYICKMTNFVPFGTLYAYITQGAYPAAIIKYILVNIAGNVILFLPMGIFLPCLFRKLRVSRNFFLFLALLLVIIEAGQVFLQLGICDIDDFIFDFLGGGLGFLLWKNGRVKALLNRTGFIRESI